MSAAIGKRLREFPSTPWYEVIGVIQDVPEHGVQEKAPEIVYWPPLLPNFHGVAKPYVWRTMTFVIRSPRAGTQSFLGELRQAVWSANSNLPLASVRTMQDVYDKSMARTSFTLVLLSVAGAMTLLLGIIGLYGVMSYGVVRRRNEIGIRIALGARSGNVLWMVLGESLLLLGAGLVLGLPLTLIGLRLVQSELYGLTASDPVSIAGSVVIIAAVTLFAAWLPARSATKVDPMVALRCD